MKPENSAVKPSALRLRLEEESRARQRMLLILQVQAGTKTATEAAGELGVSRQTFHQWEKRGLHALLQAMEEQAPGRPTTPENPETEALREELLRLKHNLAVTEEIAELRGSLLRQLEKEAAQEEQERSKKKRSHRENPPTNRRNENPTPDALENPVCKNAGGLFQSAALATTSATGSAALAQTRT